MAEPILSPDGKWMWTGLEWIPVPPTSAPALDSTIDLQDSMMSGNVNVEQNSNVALSEINFKDSAMSGDINITQNSVEDIATAMAQAFERMGFPGGERLPPSQPSHSPSVLSPPKPPPVTPVPSTYPATPMQQFEPMGFKGSERLPPSQPSLSPSVKSPPKPSPVAPVPSTSPATPMQQFQQIRQQIGQYSPAEFRQLLEMAGRRRPQPISDAPLTELEATAQRLIADPQQRMLAEYY